MPSFHRSFGQPGYRCRFEETLQIQHRIIAAPLNLPLERPIIRQKTANGLEFLLMESDDLIHIGIHRQKIISWRLYDPGQMRLRESFLDGIGHRQCMDDIADGTELDYEYILHGQRLESPFLWVTLILYPPAAKSYR
jgi:hypothetical protein